MSLGQRIYKNLFKVFGPAQLGDYHAPANPQAIVEEPCSRCGRSFADHTVERTPKISRLRCPAPVDETPATS
jgi:hypothetical protein